MKKIAAGRNYRNLKKIAFGPAITSLIWWKYVAEEMTKRGMSVGLAAPMVIWNHKDTLSAIWERKRNEGAGTSEAAGAVLDKMIDLGIGAL